ncbi:MAG: sigma-54-dependent transcriptional regulator [Bacteriovoracia bacterium]
MLQRFPLKTLLVDDDGNIRRTLTLSLKDLGCLVEQAASVEEAMKKIPSDDYDLVLTDFKMEKQTGLDLIKQLKGIRPEITIVVMTAFASFENAVQVVKEGAFDYLPKPFTNAQLAHLLGKVREIVSLRKENQDLKKSKSRRNFFSGFTSSTSHSLEEFVRKVAPTDGTVLLVGESGTGKSELAKLIHELSPRSSRPFITVYCTTLAESLLESELFGHLKGSFTGATQDKAGKLELADGGTLFLDEIGDLSPNGQAKLLRFLQDRIFERIGSNKEISVDTRIIAATNKDLPEAVASGKFREDLYYRLNMLECILAPLRHRKDDLPILVDRIFREVLVSQNLPALPLPEEVCASLFQYSWPGNIRELRNVLERVVMLSRGREIKNVDLPESVRRPHQPKKTALESPICTIEEMEKDLISRVLAVEDNQEKAAEMLGITKVTLWRKRKQYGLP